MKHQILIVDGYNMIGYWPNLRRLKKMDALEEARDELLNSLSEYSSYKDTEVIVVFDAQFVPGIKQTYQKYNLEVIFTSVDQTADEFIEAYAYERLSRINQVTVATSDLAEQWQIFSTGALRKPARELYDDILQMKKSIKKEIKVFKELTPSRRMTWDEHQLKELKNILNKLQDKSNDIKKE